MTAGAVVRAADLPAGYGVRTLIECGQPGLVRRHADLPPGARLDGSAGPGGELWFVIGGQGSIDLGGQPGTALTADRGLWLPGGAGYRLRAGDDAGLRLDMVELPAAGQRPADLGGPIVRDLADCEVEVTGDRQFRVLFGPERGCSSATQFVGEIPPGRAPDHAHPYDEVVLVLQGDGVVHMGGSRHALSPGTCTHLPPGLVHCLENTGHATMRVLGVFHPADSPAAKLAHGR